MLESTITLKPFGLDEGKDPHAVWYLVNMGPANKESTILNNRTFKYLVGYFEVPSKFTGDKPIVIFKTFVSQQVSNWQMMQQFIRANEVKIENMWDCHVKEIACMMQKRASEQLGFDFED